MKFLIYFFCEWSSFYLSFVFSSNFYIFEWNFLFYFFNTTPLSLAIETGSSEIVQLLLSHPKIDVNSKVLINKTVTNGNQKGKTISEERSMLFNAYYSKKPLIVDLLKSSPGIIQDVTNEDVDEYIANHQW